MILVTGAAGFIGSNFVRYWLQRCGEPVVSVDRFTYAARESNLDPVKDDPRHQLVRGDVGDAGLMANLLAQHQPRAVVHLAAQTHVDRSIGDPAAFLRDNVQATVHLLQACLAHWQQLPPAAAQAFRLLHVSTDEVFGDLPRQAPAAREDDPYRPGNPYAASKAAADHWVRAFGRTYGLPVLLTYGCNTYGPHQYPEKLIPLTVERALAHQPIGLYGDGQQTRDWLYVDDHCEAIATVLARGEPGCAYNVGTGLEIENRELVRSLCRLLDELRPRADGASYHSLVTPVADRLGHDRRYALNTQRLRSLGWQPQWDLATGLQAALAWQLEHP